MQVAIIGRTHWLTRVADRLIEEGHTVSLVATARAQPDYKAREEDFEHLAERCGARFLLDPDVNGPDFQKALAASGAEIGVSINWPTLIRRETCATLPKGILNGHAGDLPRYRGNACPNWAILNGEPHVGLCVHRMDPDQVDAGPIYARRRLQLDPEVYIADVYRWMDEILPDTFAEAIRRAADSTFAPEDQSRSDVRPLRCYPRRPKDGAIDWRQSATKIAGLVRASSRPFAGAFSFLEGEIKVTVWRARVVDLDHDLLAVPGQILGRGPSGGVLVASGDGAIEIEEAEREDGKPVPAANRYRLGLCLRTSE